MSWGLADCIPLPIGSMYGIYANIWGILMVNVTIYGSTMDPSWVKNGGRFISKLATHFLRSFSHPNWDPLPGCGSLGGFYVTPGSMSCQSIKKKDWRLVHGRFLVMECYCMESWNFMESGAQTQKKLHITKQGQTVNAKATLSGKSEPDLCFMSFQELLNLLTSISVDIYWHLLTSIDIYWHLLTQKTHDKKKHT